METSRVFNVEHTPHEFNGKWRHMFDDVDAKNCEEAVIKFKEENPRFQTVTGVKPLQAVRWRREKSLLNAKRQGNSQ